MCLYQFVQARKIFYVHAFMYTSKVVVSVFQYCYYPICGSILNFSYLFAEGPLWGYADEVFLWSPSGDRSRVRRQDRLVLSTWPTSVRSQSMCPRSTSTSSWGEPSLQSCSSVSVSGTTSESQPALSLSSFVCVTLVQWPDAKQHLHFLDSYIGLMIPRGFVVFMKSTL